MAGVFLVMASAVRALDRWDAERGFLRKIAKIATAEIVSSKDFNAIWQRAAATLLVAIGSHDPDLMMEEIFLYFSGPTSALPAMLQILADFASAEVYPTIKGCAFARFTYPRKCTRWPTTCFC